MKNHQLVCLPALFMSFAMCGAWVAGGQTVNHPATSSTSALDNGTLLVAELTWGLNSKKAKPGDTIKAKITQDAIAHGRIVVRRDSKLIGHVTEVKSGNKADHESSLGIVFDKVILKGGGEAAFQGLIEALAAPIPMPSRVDQPDQMLPPAMMVPNTGGNSPQPISGAGAGRGNSSQSGTMGSSSQRGSNAPGVQPPVTPGTQAPTNSAGGLSVGAHGVIGMRGITLNTGATGTTKGSLVTATKDQLKLEMGTQMVVQVHAQVNIASKP
ncbi:MAG TPA: hypothetical protein VN176_03700 [Verrucomicrobiae bacterium]|jgi:hypothetical protein|nr:hypothetical protein [Verrucomicrobiae bacterium]